MMEIPEYPLAIFINIASEVTHADDCEQSAAVR
jgi:hypothetical protein